MGQLILAVFGGAARGTRFVASSAVGSSSPTSRPTLFGSIIVPLAVLTAPGAEPGERRTIAIASAIALRSENRSSGFLASARRISPSTPTGTPASGAASARLGAGSIKIFRATS